MKIEFSRQIFRKKYSNAKFHRNPSGVSRIVLMRDGQTDRHDEKTSRFSRFCEKR